MNKRTITFIRHAKSSWDTPTLRDFDRPLNERGLKAAPMMGQRLKKQNIIPDTILSSPAKRAKKTAKIIAKEIGYDEKKIEFLEDIYEASLGDIIYIISQLPDHIFHVFLIGHNPTLTMAANSLGNSPIANMPTAAVYSIEFAIDHWPDITSAPGKTILFDFPKNK